MALFRHLGVDCHCRAAFVYFAKQLLIPWHHWADKRKHGRRLVA